MIAVKNCKLSRRGSDSSESSSFLVARGVAHFIHSAIKDELHHLRHLCLLGLGSFDVRQQVQCNVY